MGVRTEVFGGGGKIPDGFEEAGTTGIHCMKCGATVQNQGDYPSRHREWHEELERRLDDR